MGAGWVESLHFLVARCWISHLPWQAIQMLLRHAFSCATLLLSPIIVSVLLNENHPTPVRPLAVDISRKKPRRSWKCAGSTARSKSTAGRSCTGAHSPPTHVGMYDPYRNSAQLSDHLPTAP